MKKLLLRILLLILPVLAEAQIATSQSVIGFAAGFPSVTTANLPAPSAASGSLFICDYGGYFGTTVSCSDNKANSYVDVFGGALSSAYDGQFYGGQFAKENGVGGAGHNFTLTLDSRAI